MIPLATALHSTSVASGLLSGPGHYIHWGVIQISLTNLLILVAMAVVFVLALVLPFPGSHAEPQHEERSDAQR